MPKIKELHGALNNILENIQLADDEVDSVIKIKHPKKYTINEYEARISKK